jgi:hypothetical protein
MDACNPITTPLEISVKFSHKQSPSSKKKEYEMANVPYSRVVGSLIYCMVGIRPNVTIVMGVVAQFFNNFRLAHWQVVKRLLKYLQGSQKTCITILY